MYESARCQTSTGLFAGSVLGVLIAASVFIAQIGAAREVVVLPRQTPRIVDSVCEFGKRPAFVRQFDDTNPPVSNVAPRKAGARAAVFELGFTILLAREGPSPIVPAPRTSCQFRDVTTPGSVRARARAVAFDPTRVVSGDAPPARRFPITLRATNCQSDSGGVAMPSGRGSHTRMAGSRGDVRWPEIGM